MIKTNAVWLITGCSRGLGRALAEAALEAGHRVVATARRKGDLDGLKGANDHDLLRFELDVTRPGDAKAAVAAAADRFGGVDVLVNNAGYGYFGAIEEGVDAEVRLLMETDVYGPLELVKAVLPHMRRQRSGHIVNVSSIGGFVTFPSVGYYHMAKFALEGMSETLAKEVKPFGIGVTIVQPGAFRTDFRKPDATKDSTVRIEDYEATVGKNRDSIFANHGKQVGDPALGARAILTAIAADDAPVRLIIGGDAVDQARRKIAELQAEIDRWEPLSRSTNLTEHLPA